MSPLVWIHIIVGTIVITIATIIYIKDEKERKTQMTKAFTPEELKHIRDELKLSTREVGYLCNISNQTVKQFILKAQEQEKENELLKEIIKSLFDRGCPLHQYIDKEFGLTIEVDNECSIMRLGEYKGIDLDKYLKEVLEKE